MLDRRGFLAAMAAAYSQSRSAGRTMHISVDGTEKKPAIPRDFIGLGYEISSVAVPGLLSATNREYVALVKTLAPEGVIRVGGITSDNASYAAAGEAKAATQGSVINRESLEQLGSFLEATNWRLIWGLNLGSGSEEEAATEAAAVVAAVGKRLLALEIGNEPDGFGGGTRHRPKTYRYQDYLADFRRYQSAIWRKVPNAPLAGPDVAGATDWVGRFAADEGHNLKLLTHHYYRECAGAGSTLNKLLREDTKVRPLLEALRAASTTSRVPYRICEANSFCGGGKPGVSDTFGAALWALEFMHKLALGGCAGVNMETGLNQLGFVSSYSPIRGRAGSWFAAPEYYGMLAFRHGCQGAPVAVRYEADGMNVSAYALAGGKSSLALTVLNKEPALGLTVQMEVPGIHGRGQVLRLTGPSLQESEGVRFAGSAVSEGSWNATTRESVAAHRGRAALAIPAASAAVIRWG